MRTDLTDMKELIVTFSPPPPKKNNTDQGGMDGSSGNMKVGVDLPLVQYWPIVVFATVFTRPDIGFIS
jgi:hypothetical protein